MSCYKIDTHVHTSEVSSCGTIPAKEVVHLYKEAGYNGIVITDHFYKGYFDNLDTTEWKQKIDCYLDGYRKAHDEGLKIGLTVILGMEIRFDENANDYLVYGADEQFLLENENLFKLSLKEFNKLIEDKEILIYQAHPFRPGMHAADPGLLHGIEVYNGNPRHNSNNWNAFEYAVNHDLKMLSGSDFHQISDLARGGIFLSESINSCVELVRLLNDNRILKLIQEGD